MFPANRHRAESSYLPWLAAQNPRLAWHSRHSLEGTRAITPVTFRLGGTQLGFSQHFVDTVPSARIDIMRMRLYVVFPVLVLLCSGTLLLRGQQSATDNSRAVIRKVVPSYPETAKRINLAGTVKLLATVAPNGTVKSIQPLGGSPILLQAAQDAVYRWQFAPASSETKESIELRFSPQ